MNGRRAGGPQRALICDFGGVIAHGILRRPAENGSAALSERLLAAIRVEEGVLASVRRVRSLGWRTALLTNNSPGYGPEWRSKIPEIDSLFDIVVDASVTGIRKPDPAAYRLALSMLGVTPENCVFVDDLAANCAAAAELGMRTVLFQSGRESMSDLEAAVAMAGEA